MHPGDLVRIVDTIDLPMPECARTYGIIVRVLNEDEPNLIAAGVLKLCYRVLTVDGSIHTLYPQELKRVQAAVHPT